MGFLKVENISFAMVFFQKFNAQARSDSEDFGKKIKRKSEIRNPKPETEEEAWSA
jgi:hypothetical protein